MFTNIVMSLVITNSELLPQDLGSDDKRLPGNGHEFLAAAKHIDHINRRWYRFEIGIAGLAEYFLVARIHRNHSIAMFKQVLANEVAGPMPLFADTDDCNGFAVSKDAAQFLNARHVCMVS